jgi:AcrR family transcriptional regulator
MDGDGTHGGRPRSEAARVAVLHAVDDLLVDVGYAAMTIRGIAQRAGVSRQTVYRWWSTKAEILFEACVADAEQELAVDAAADPVDELTAYLEALAAFLGASPAGAAYRALLGEAQHDPAVAALLASRDVLGDSARVVVRRVAGDRADARRVDRVVARLVGPTFYWLLAGRATGELEPRDEAAALWRELGAAADELAAR